MTRVLVLGGGGQVGRALARTAWPKGWTVDVRSRGAWPGGVDLTDETALARALEAPAPDVVVNAAAYTAVDKAEDEPDAAYAVNAAAPARLAALCREQGAALIHISTDYVFDGSGAKAWREDDPIGPLNVYGRSKAEGEAGVRDALRRHAILRTSWVYDAASKNFLTTMLRLAGERDHLRIVDDQIGAPTAAADLAEAIAKIAPALLGDDGTYGTYHATNSGETSWAGFADAIFAELARRGRARPTVERIASADWPTPAKRPKNSRLDGARLRETFALGLREWRAAMEDVMNDATGEAQ